VTRDSFLTVLCGRLRRAGAGAAITAFALVQAVAPLLHAHVHASAAANQAGIHLPVALVHDGHGHQAATLAAGVVLEESSAITAPPEHRRDEGPAGIGSPGMAAPFLVVVAESAPAVGGTAADTVSSAVRHLHPPSQAPPAAG
jgi:hypothetical protein